MGLNKKLNPTNNKVIRLFISQGAALCGFFFLNQSGNRRFRGQRLLFKIESFNQ